MIEIEETRNYNYKYIRLSTHRIAASIVSILSFLLGIFVCLMLSGCSSTTHKVFKYDEELKKVVLISETVHNTFMMSEKMGSLQYEKDNDKVTLKMGNVVIDPQSLEFRAFQFGVRIGEAKKEEEGDAQ